MGEIFRFSIASFGRPTAVEYMLGLDEALARLGAYPEIGRIDRALEPPMHVFQYRSHRVFYQFDGATVSVVRILHHAMNAAAHLRMS
ncbi:MAG: type II toxin-antitoxin system RelE/ParE family toxin [Altererythrobacter sp.]|nr:type II toxin-antitoxin system RelE/ParE family toxin [Altererythrobacter sp.]